MSANMPVKKLGFGEERAQEMEKRLNDALKERRKLAAAENVADDPLKQYVQRKGSLVERSIARMQNLVSRDKTQR